MIYDLIVIGGGPAGIMAAGRASETGANVLLLEKNSKIARKLLITGKGRCNITNTGLNLKNLTDKFGSNGKFLLTGFNEFNDKDIVKFFEERKLKIKVTRGERVFPESDLSSDVLKVLEDYLKQGQVTIKTNVVIKSIILKNNLIDKIILNNQLELRATKYIIATGGKTYPSTGSTGDGYEWLIKMGHFIVETKPALSPLIIKEGFIKELEGLSLKNVDISVYQNNKKIDSRFGEALFTAKGVSGPIILDMSKNIGKALTKKEVKLKIDYKPGLTFNDLDKRIQNDFKKFNKKIFKNCLNNLAPKKLIPLIIKLSKISPNKKVSFITKEERKKLVHLFKSFELSVECLTGFDKAIITSGGVSLKEIDPKTMQSKIIKNLYLAGEILDLDGPTGGYNLQICWSTGWLAGSNILNK
ncbi:NAD(P)/FAD-dependent oxidoreductase [Patescibacteria group bacterium]|nr:NAD(P)/FAD-dependent oxidoreductase [Patescibacteria group bacterium]